MHNYMIYLKEKDEMIKELTEDEAYELLSTGRDIDYTDLVTDKDEIRQAILQFLREAKIDVGHMETTENGIVLHFDYDNLVNALYMCFDDLEGLWFVNDGGYEVVTMADYLRILLLNHPGEDVDLEVHAVYDFHF